MRHSARAFAAALSLASALAGAVMFSPAASASTHRVSPNYTCSLTKIPPKRTGNYVVAEQIVQCPTTPKAITNDVRIIAPNGKHEECDDYTTIATGTDVSCTIKWYGHGKYHYSFAFHVSGNDQGGLTSDDKTL